MSEQLAEIARLAKEALGVAEVDGSLRDTANRIEEAFHAGFSPDDVWEGPYRVRDVFADHPLLGNSIVVLDKKAGVLQAATYTDTGEAVEFAPRAEWQPVELTYQFTGAASESDPPADGELSESGVSIAEFDGRAMEITEQGDIATGGNKPLIMTIRPIKAGWGNSRDNHYYPIDMLEAGFASAYDGVKMFETNHIDAETNNRNWVSTYMETQEVDGVGPVGKVGVHDPGFAQKVLNLQELGLLEKLECSIRGPGKGAPFEKDGRKGKSITELASGHSIDWVPKGGAGGQALPLAESEEGAMTEKEKEQEQEQPTKAAEVEPTPAAPVTISEQDAVNIIDAAATLPDVTKAMLKTQVYETAEQVAQAVEGQIAYVKALTGSGQPVGQTNQPPPPATQEDRTEQLNESYARIEARYGMAQPQGAD